MRITDDEVRHIATLARIGMTGDEVERMRDEMSQILESFDVLRQIDTGSVEPTGHSVDLDSVVRADEVAASSPVADVLLNAPATEDDFVRVRAVLDG